MTSITASSKVLIGHPTFSRSIESHGSAHSADTNYNGWRGEGTVGNEDIGTQTDYSGGSLTGGGRTLLSESKRRKEDAIVDISLESMKYNGGKYIIYYFVFIIKKLTISKCKSILFDLHTQGIKIKFYF
jgi:hypothetical protein